MNFELLETIQVTQKELPPKLANRMFICTLLYIVPCCHSKHCMVLSHDHYNESMYKACLLRISCQSHHKSHIPLFPYRST